MAALATVMFMAGLAIFARLIFTGGFRRSRNEAEARVLTLLENELDQTQFSGPPEKQQEERRAMLRSMAERLGYRLENAEMLKHGDGASFMEKLDRELTMAGLSHRWTAHQALALALMVWVAGIVFPTFMLLAVGLPKALYAMLTVGIFVYPPMSLRRMKRRRQESIQAELPIFIQQLAMALSTGSMSLDDAIARTVRNAELSPVVSELSLEYKRAVTEYRHGGMDREVALRGVSARTGVLAVDNLNEAIIQGLRTGAEMSHMLEQYAVKAREMWRQDMRAFKARKEPILTISLVITMGGGFILIAGPLFLNALTSMKGM